MTNHKFFSKRFWDKIVSRPYNLLSDWEKTRLMEVGLLVNSVELTEARKRLVN